MRKLSVITAGLAVAAAALAVPGTARAANYNEWQTGNGLCMGVQGGDSKVVANNPAAIITWACDGTSNQFWSEDLNSGAAGYVLLRNGANPKECLSVLQMSQNLGAQLVIWQCKDPSQNQDQRWAIADAPTSLFINYNSNLIAVPLGSGQGANVVQGDGRAQYHWSRADFVGF
jgi:hypothetical protein